VFHENQGDASWGECTASESGPNSGPRGRTVSAYTYRRFIFLHAERIVTGPIITVSGLRGIVGQTLTPDIAARYVAAFAAELPPGPVVLGRDGRESGPMLAEAIRRVLASAGRTVLDADVVATPTLGVLLRHHGAAGGVQITASHNPAEYNGIKLFGGDGSVIPAAAGEKVKAHYETGALQQPSAGSAGSTKALTDASQAHLELVFTTVNVPRIRRRRFRLLLDSNHGAGGQLGRKLLVDSLGCDLIAVGDTPDGRFAHPPEPTAENLRDISTKVSTANVDVGFCQDPDADRLALIDENGRYIGEEYTLALCVDHVLRYQKGPIVTNCSTSRTSQDLAAKYGVPFFRSAVGEANVTAEMRRVGAVFGGEGSGGPIDPRVGYVRDSFAGMALILDAMAAREMPISALADELPRYAIEKTKVTISPEKVAAAFDALERHFSDAQPDRLDGLRLDWPDRWLLVRASNTEPIVRIIAEARDEASARELCQAAGRVMASC
jgi:phosphomannomutase